MENFKETGGRVKRLADKLNELQHCFELASKVTERSDLKAQFIELSADHKDMALEMERHAKRLAGTNDVPDSVSSILSEGLLTVRSLVGLDDTETALRECENRVDDIKQDYELALEEPDEPELHELYRNHAKALESTSQKLTAIQQVLG